MKKIICFIVIALTAVCFLISCGNEDDNSSDTATPVGIWEGTNAEGLDVKYEFFEDGTVYIEAIGIAVEGTYEYLPMENRYLITLFETSERYSYELTDEIFILTDRRGAKISLERTSGQ